jgi:hypothetical protein
MSNNELTTISLSYSTKKRLETHKIHPNESYDDALNRVLDKAEGKES